MQLQNQTSAAIQLSKPVIFGHRGGFDGGFGDVDATWRCGPPVSPPLSSLSLLSSLSSLLSLSSHPAPAALPPLSLSSLLSLPKPAAGFLWPPSLAALPAPDFFLLGGFPPPAPVFLLPRRPSSSRAVTGKGEGEAWFGRGGRRRCSVPPPEWERGGGAEEQGELALRLGEAAQAWCPNGGAGAPLLPPSPRLRRLLRPLRPSPRLLARCARRVRSSARVGGGARTGRWRRRRARDDGGGARAEQRPWRSGAEAMPRSSSAVEMAAVRRRKRAVRRRSPAQRHRIGRGRREAGEAEPPAPPLRSLPTPLRSLPTPRHGRSWRGRRRLRGRRRGG